MVKMSTEGFYVREVGEEIVSEDELRALFEKDEKAKKLLGKLIVLRLRDKFFN